MNSARARSAWRTDLLLAAFDGEVIARDDYCVARTLANPSFWFGNFLLWPRPPRPGERAAWEAAFEREFADLPAVRHRLHLWDEETASGGAAQEFVDAGYELVSSLFLAAERTRQAQRSCEGLEVRAIEGDAEWARALAIQHATMPEGVEREAFGRFQARNLERYRAMQAAGFGAWYGGFLAGEQVAGLGIFGADGLARCQAVATHPDHQRRGVCAALLHAAVEQARERLRAERCWIFTDPDGGARRVYEAVGFEPAELVQALVRAPDSAG